MKVKRIFCTVMFIIMLLVTSNLTVFANFNSEKDAIKDIESYAYYMISLDDNTEMFSKNAKAKLQPAAFNKLVAAIVAIEQWGNLDEKITVTEQSLSLVKYEYGIRTAQLKVGDVYTKRQLIDCLIIFSANDVASVIAYNISKTKEAFEQKMQQLVEKIGCKNTKIVDMLGFDEKGQYTTAKDIAKIVKYGLDNPVFSEAFSSKNVTMPATGENEERVFIGSNKMANATIPDYYHSSVTGGKQGSTDEAGECIAVTSSKDGYSYLTVVMKGFLSDIDKDGIDENTCMTDAKKLLEWVYENIRFKVVASPGQIVHCLEVSAAKNTDTLKLTPEKEISVLAPSKVSSYSVLIQPIESTIPKKIRAPIKAGTVICQAKVLYANKELTKINLVASEDISLSITGLIISFFSSVLMSKPFIALEIVSLIILVGYLIIKIYNAKNIKAPGLHIVENSESAKKRPPQKAEHGQPTGRRPGSAQNQKNSGKNPGKKSNR